MTIRLRAPLRYTRDHLCGRILLRALSSPQYRHTMRRKRHLDGAAIAGDFNGELSLRLEQILELGTYRAEVRIDCDVIRAWRRIEIERNDNFRVVEYA